MIFIAILIGSIIGALIGITAPTIPYTYSNYLAIAIVAALDWTTHVNKTPTKTPNSG